MKIIEYPNKILRKKSHRIKNLNEINLFMAEFIVTMIAKDGIGLAAPQVGKNINLIAVNLKDQPQLFINPIIIYKNFLNKKIIEEGCLSFPDIFGLVKRPQIIWLLYRTNKGKRKLSKFKGLIAVIIQHEIDHLRGKLFIDKVIRYTKGEDKINKLLNQASNEEK